MTLNEFRELTKDMDGDVELRLMTQPNYPLESEVNGLTLRSRFDSDAIEQGKEEKLYLLEGGQIGYGRRAAWNSTL